MQTASKTTRVSREEFLRNLCDSGLLAQEEIDRLPPPLPGPNVADGDAVARELVAAGKLTAYQAQAVRERHFSELLLGNYEILDRLGAGGMGTVFKARHRRMKRVVALKVLSRDACHAPTFLQRFQREVEVISRLSHPNIVMAFDADEAEAGHFLVMEFVNGRDLASEVQTRGPLSVREAIDCLLQAARALEYAHGQGIIHRDIKPANLLRDTSGVLKVADLGLARLNAAVGPGSNGGVTQAGGVVGTVDYMPPEQALDSTTIDHRADIYSLGCTLHFLLIGGPPYPSDSMMAALLKHREAPIPSLPTARPDVPPAVDAVFRKMMAKKMADRHQTMTEVVQALEALEPAVRSVTGKPAPMALPPMQPAATGVLESGITTTLGAVGKGDAGITVDLSSQRKDASSGLPVLLVEPSRTQASIIRKFLQELGTSDILVAPSGQKALEVMRRTRPRAVLSAMHLDDMTGAQLLEKIRGEEPLADVGFVLITASQADASPETSLRGRARTALLSKPFDRDKLSQALDAAQANGGA